MTWLLVLVTAVSGRILIVAEYDTRPDCLYAASHFINPEVVDWMCIPATSASMKGKGD